MYTGVHVKYSLLCQIVMGLESTRQFSKKKKGTQILNFMKILPVGDELFHADRRTEKEI